MINNIKEKMLLLKNNSNLSPICLKEDGYFKIITYSKPSRFSFEILDINSYETIFCIWTMNTGLLCKEYRELQEKHNLPKNITNWSEDHWFIVILGEIFK